MADAIISFGPNAQRSAVSTHAMNVLKNICATAGVTRATISSTARSIESQARIMYNNIERYGVAQQKRLYRAPGQAVINTYAAAKNEGLSPTAIQARMTAKIRSLGPASVSRHLDQGGGRITIDVAPSSISPVSARSDFVRAVQAHPKVDHFLQPPRDPAYHLEIVL